MTQHADLYTIIIYCEDQKSSVQNPLRRWSHQPPLYSVYDIHVRACAECIHVVLATSDAHASVAIARAHIARRCLTFCSTAVAYRYSTYCAFVMVQLSSRYGQATKGREDDSARNIWYIAIL